MDGCTMFRNLPKEFLFIVVVILGLATAEILSKLLGFYLTRPLAKGMAYLVVSLLILFLFRRDNGLNIFVRLGLCLLVAILAFVGTYLWPA